MHEINFEENWRYRTLSKLETCSRNQQCHERWKEWVAQATLRKFGTFRGMGAGWSRDHFPVTKWAHLTERTIHHISANHNWSVHPCISNPSRSDHWWVLECSPGVCQGFTQYFFLQFLPWLQWHTVLSTKMYVLVSVYQVQVAKQSCARLMGTASWRDILVLIGRMKRFPMHITGQICSPTWHILYVLVRCALHPKVQISCVWGPNLSHPSHFNLLQVGLWIWLYHYIRKIHSLHSSLLILQTTIVVFKINSSFIFFQNYYLTILKLLE